MKVKLNKNMTDKTKKTALFTEEEMNYYHENKKEVVKRTITILLERVCSQLQNLNF